MKKKLAVVFGISISLGVSYFLWSYSGVGKKVLSQWIIKRWSRLASLKDKTLDVESIKNELNKLDYEDHELLARYTLLDLKKTNVGDSEQSKTATLLKKLNDRQIFQRADLSALNDIIFTTELQQVTI